MEPLSEPNRKEYNVKYIVKKYSTLLCTFGLALGIATTAMSEDKPAPAPTPAQAPAGAPAAAAPRKKKHRLWHPHRRLPLLHLRLR